MIQPNIAFLGAGNMNSAIIRGLIDQHYPLDNLSISNRTAEKLQPYSCHTTTENLDCIKNADIIILGVKPQLIQTVCKQIDSLCAISKPLIISIAAGITLTQLQTYFNYDAAIVRAMPNTPVSIGLGATALCANTFTSESHRDHSTMIFDAVGISHWLASDDDMDAVVSLSGSGPAYVFLMMQAMENAAIKMGLDPELCKQFCTQTFLGAAELAHHTNADFETLRHQVTSPNGTTHAAITSMLNDHFPETIEKAMLANIARSKEITADNT